MGKAVLADLVVSSLQSVDERGLRIVPVKVAISGHEGFYGQPTGFLAAFVSAHTVGDYSQSAFAQELAVVVRLPIAERVLVILAQASNVGLTGDFNAGSNHHAVTILEVRVTDIGKQITLRHKP
jgi:hypothetical protein